MCIDVCVCVSACVCARACVYTHTHRQRSSRPGRLGIHSPRLLCRSTLAECGRRTVEYTEYPTVRVHSGHRVPHTSVARRRAGRSRCILKCSRYTAGLQIHVGDRVGHPVRGEAVVMRSVFRPPTRSTLVPREPRVPRPCSRAGCGAGARAVPSAGPVPDQCQAGPVPCHFRASARSVRLPPASGPVPCRASAVPAVCRIWTRPADSCTGTGLPPATLRAMCYVSICICIDVHSYV